MKRNIIYSSIIALVLLSICGCQKESIPTWTEKGSIWFNLSNQKDTMTFTFASLPDDSTEAIVKLPIALCGAINSKDRTIDIAIAQEPHNAKTKYEIQQPISLLADSTSAFLKVKVWRTDNLNEERDTIAFSLKASEDLDVAFTSHLTCYLVLSNHYEKPDWWNANMDYFLGEYNEEKLRIINLVLGSTDNPYPNMDNATWRLNKYKLDQYIEKYHPTYSDGTPITFGDNY